MAKYYPLEKIFHMNLDAESEYKMRINSPSSFITNLNITPIIKGEKTKEVVPLFVLNTINLVNITEKILSNSKNIVEQQSLLPDIAREKFLNLLLINELQSTNSIESIKSSKRELSEILMQTKNQDSPNNIKRFLGLVKLYFHIGECKDISDIKDFRKIYDMLVSEEISEENKLDGDLFRKKSVNVFAGDKIIHRGVTSEQEINHALENLIHFFENSNLPTLYTALIGHYFFEYIHPFYDGNGRVGRFLLANILSQKVDKYTAITLSYSINRNKNKYYKTFINASHPLNKGEMTFFIGENLEILEQGQQNILKFLTENIEKLNIISLYLAKNITDINLKNILFLLAQSYLFSAKDNLITHNEIAQTLEISPKTLNKYLNENLDKIEIIKKKPKIYKLSDDFVNMMLVEGGSISSYPIQR